MPADPLGRLLEHLCAQASAELVLCAPFAKTAVLSRLLAQLPETGTGTEVVLITRWRPEEVARGVSDVGVLPVVERVGGRVVLHDQLHAKYFRTSERVLIGSANLTGRALGWTWPSNVELLAPVPVTVITALERRLLEEGVHADASVAQDIQDRADQLGHVPAPEEVLIPDAEEMWLPSLRYPQDLFEAYQRGPEVLSRQSAVDAAKDLLALGLVPGLPRSDFERSVCAAVWSSEVLEAVKPQLRHPARFGAITSSLQRRFDLDRDKAQMTWQTLMRWLLVFCGDRVQVEVARRSEIVVLRPEGEDG